MGLFDFIGKSRRAGEPVSISNTVSVRSAAEDLSRPDGSLPPEDSISGEEITRGTRLLETYEVVSDAIRGGMGSVWKVRHHGWNADLAMKRPLPKFFAEGSESRKQAFVRECESWISLGLHPNIVSCFYVREIGGVPSVFSEWMENGSLKDRIRDGTLYSGTEEEVQERLLKITAGAARGLHYAHESAEHLIHQDVKPDNLLLTRDWEAKVSDFGLARARIQLTGEDGSAGFTAGATLVTPSGGRTPAYCAPEQAAGQPVTRRADLYSWAVSVMEMYLGSRPWSDGITAGLRCREHLSACRVRMPEPLRELLIRCMEQDPDRRPHDFALAESVLKQVFRDTLGRDCPLPDPEAAADTADSLNNRALTFLDLGFPGRAAGCWAQALEKEPDCLNAVWNQGLFLWRSGQIDFEELCRRCSAAGREGEDALLRRLLDQAEAERRDTLPRVLQEPDEEIVRFGKAFWEPKPACGTAVSPDGKRIYTLSAGSLCCYDSESLQKRWENESGACEDGYGTQPLLLTPDGKTLLFGSGGRENRVIAADAATGRMLRKFEGGNGLSCTAFAADPDGRHCFIACGPQSVRKTDLETGACAGVFQPLPMRYGDPSALCVSPDGTRLYAVTFCSLAEWDASSGRLLRVLDTDFRGTGISPSPDGKTLYISGIYGCRRFRTGDGVLDEPPCLEGLRAVFVCPGGKYLLGAGHNAVLKLLDPERQLPVRVFHGHLLEIYSVSPAADLSVIVTSGHDGAVFVWDAFSPVNRAPWELSRVRRFSDQMSLQRQQEAAEQEIRSAVQSGETGRAVSLLEQAEEKFGPHPFLPLRRKLAALCDPGELTGVYETLRFPAAEDARGEWGGNERPAFDPRGGSLAAAAKYYPDIHIFSETGRRIARMERAAEDLVYSPSGRLLLASDGDSVTVFDTDSAAELYTISGFPGPQYDEEITIAAAVSPDEKLIAAGGCRGFVGVWDAARGTLLHSLELGFFEVTRVLFTGFGNRAAVSTRTGQLVLLDAGTGKILQSADAGLLGCASPDGKTLYLFESESCTEMVVWDVPSWSRRGSFSFPEGRSFQGICVSPDGALIAAGGSGGVMLFSLPDMKPLWESAELSTSYYESGSLAFSPDGCLLCAGKGVYLHLLALRRKLIPRL